MEHGDAVDVGSGFHGDAAVEAVGFGVRDRYCTSSFYTGHAFSGSSCCKEAGVTYWVLRLAMLRRFPATMRP